MINTCDDPCVCSWSIDGTYFVVMNVSKFEKEIIPQFFKSTFTSFVRQLYYYGFRNRSKINNNIRIDAATANYCEFYHPKFQQGRTDLLKDVKRLKYEKRGNKNQQLNATKSVSISNEVTESTLVDDEGKCNDDQVQNNIISTTVTPINRHPPSPSHILQSNIECRILDNDSGDIKPGVSGGYYDSDCNSTDSDLVF